jgi:uncharacterized protein (TIGR00255 family)
MLLSMTGYGRAEAPFDRRRLSVEVRSVNHRFCEISVRSPKALANLEGRIRERTQALLSRGKIYVNLALDGQENEAGALRVNEAVAAAYLGSLRELQHKLGLLGEIDISILLNLPDVLTWDGEAVDEERAWRLTEPVLERALADILAMKSREGANLSRDLLERVALIQSALERVVARVPEMLGAQRDRLANRLAEISQDLEYNRQRLEAEVVLFVDRTDCTEECIRLRSHLEQFREIVRAPEPAGRKLNFLLQEMNREANTIGSKVQDVSIARDVIVIKEEIERIREQVQNFE